MNEVKNMKHRLFLILFVVLLLTGCAVSTDKDVTYKQITISEAVEMMASESDYIILDVRRPDEFATGHIPKCFFVYTLSEREATASEAESFIWKKLFSASL